MEAKALPLSLLKNITDDFSNNNEIGRGGFAVVYKVQTLSFPSVLVTVDLENQVNADKGMLLPVLQGLLENGAVAVKKLSDMSVTDERRFLGEVVCLMKAKHQNIVRFLGYCSDTQGQWVDYNGKSVMGDVRQRLLCFEYLPNRSLDKYIKGTIYHVASNDFGISRCFDGKQTHTVTANITGSMGYLAPEVFYGKISFKSDIFSLGVIIIEILTGHKDYPDVKDVRRLHGPRYRLDAHYSSFYFDHSLNLRRYISHN
nr:unnamed protein product [Digitaria exilis]